MSENILTNEWNPFNKYKNLAWYNEMIAIKNNQFKPPINVALDPIQGTGSKKLCGGFSCRFCMSNLEDQGQCAKIPSDIFLSIPKFFSEWGVRSICIAGHHSDPCVYNHKDLIKFMKDCKDYNIDIGLVTNGSLFTKELIESSAHNCKWVGFSVNAGNENDHALLTGTPKGTFAKVIDNIKYLSNYIKENNLKCQVGYKFLITPENYMNILDAVKIAKESGVRHMQIRPCELPIEQSKLIDTKVVDEQIKEGLKYQTKDFEIFCIKEKFTAELTKRQPKRCIISPLGSTFMADGSVCPCPDRRWSSNNPDFILGNFITEGLESIRKKWGGPEHKKMIENINKDLDNCIRCTFYSAQEIYEHCVENDELDITLI